MPEFDPSFFVDYFSGMVTVEHRSVKWNAGLQAAHLWQDYHIQRPTTPLLLHAVIRVLMPYRLAGSGFHALWTLVVLEIDRFPVSEQILLWHDIFSLEHVGDTRIHGASHAHRALVQWGEIATNAPDHEAAHAVMLNILDDVYPFFPSSFERGILINRLHDWFALILPDVSFRHLVLARRREHRLSQGHTN